MIMDMRLTSFVSVAALGMCLADARAAETPGLDPEGYIIDWIMLAPIPLPAGRPAADLILAEQIPGEAALKPKAGDTLALRGKEWTWRQITATNHYFDFNAQLKSQHDHVAGFMVTYIECDVERPGTILTVGSNDQGRIYFNGVDIYAVTEARPLALDSDKGRVTLKKGVNVIVFKVINEQNSWQGSIRLTDKTGAPLKDVKIKVAP